MVLVAHLFILQVYAGSFGTSWWRETACCFSQCPGHRETFHGLGVQDDTELNFD
jgi:hypothetical protein